MSKSVEAAEGHKPGIVERLGKENVTNYLLILTAIFAGMGLIDIGANCVLPALHSLDGAAGAGLISLGTGVTAVINEVVHS
jgi:hypothetical protein